MGVLRSILLATISVAAFSGACGGAGETETSSDDGAGGFITGAGGSSSSTAPTTTGTGATGGAPTTSSTVASGGTGGVGTGGAGGGGGTGGSGGTCVDIGLGEPNSTEGTAYSLQPSAIEDCDGDGDTVTGVISPGDVDWFYYEGDDTTFCIVDPTRALSQSQSGLRLCKYFECISGNTTFSCPGGTSDDTSPGGRQGCCGTNGFDVTDLNCVGSLDEQVFVYLRLDQPGGGAGTCNEYTLDYHY